MEKVHVRLIYHYGVRSPGISPGVPAMLASSPGYLRIVGGIPRQGFFTDTTDLLGNCNVH